MAISSAGIGSGLNVQSIVSQLVAVESQPIKLLQSKNSALQTKMSVFGQIKSELSTLQDASSALVDSTTWNALTVSSSNTSAFTGTVTTGAQSGSHTIEVNNLVSAQSLKSPSFAATDTMGTSGTLSFYTGYYDSNNNFASSGVADTVSVSPTDTITDVVKNINAKSSTLGVTASVVTVADKQQLVIRGNTAGASNAFQIDASAGLSALRFMPADVVQPGTTTVSAAKSTTPSVEVTQGMAAADAKVTIDGIAVTSSTNTVSGALTGVTLNLLSQTTTPAQMSVDLDKTSMKTKIQAFQDSYNKLYADLKTQTAYNSATKTGGPLLGDNTAVSIQNMMRTLIGSNGPATSTINRLSNLGLEIQADGSLSTNSTKLDAALQDPSNVKAFFSANTGTASGNGIAKRVYDFAFGALSIGGSASTHSTSFQTAIDSNNKSIDRFNLHLSDYQAQLLKQYNALDASMAKLNSLSSYVTQQIATWNKTG